MVNETRPERNGEILDEPQADDVAVQVRVLDDLQRFEDAGLFNGHSSVLNE